MTDHLALASSARPPLRAVNVSRTYGASPHEVHAVRSASLAVATGELVVITGPSGAGKSTLVHLLGGLDDPTEGHVEIDGDRLSALSSAGLAMLRRRKIGFLLQAFSLLPALTALENVALPLRLDRRSDAAVLATAALEDLGLANRGTHLPSALSGGEQQRVALARALVPSPALLLADEPTGALDSETGEHILQLLRSAASRGQTTVVVSHDPRAVDVADRVFRLVDGVLTEQDHSR